MSIKALFFAKFDTQEGPKIIHQVPSDAIAGSHAPFETPTSSSDTLFNFSDISFFVIPRQELCGNLITVCKDGNRILGYPICVKSSKYDRNEFIFNFCFVLSEDEDFSPFKSVVQKLANLMRGLEEQSFFLSKDQSKPGEGKIYSLCEMLMEDLNNYCECMIPIDDLNTLNIKLFPTYAPPPAVKAWHVPIFTVRPQALTDDNWDLTMQRILPHINGISSVKQIAILADADIKLTKKCIKHLLYYNCLLLLDVFSFSAIYAPTSQFSSTIASDPEMQQECAVYVNTAFAPSFTSSTTVVPEVAMVTSSSPGSSSLRDPTIPTSSIVTLNSAIDIFPLTATGSVVDGVALVELYAALSQGLSVKQWYNEHSSALANIDIRRFITFGVIKGFLYRVHKYAYLSGSGVGNQSFNGNGTGNTPTNTSSYNNGISAPLIHPPSTSTPPPPYIPSGSATTITPLPPSADTLSTPIFPSTAATEEQSDLEQEISDQDLLPYLDGTHPFDQICTDLEISERVLMGRLRGWNTRNAMGGGEISIIHR